MHTFEKENIVAWWAYTRMCGWAISHTQNMRIVDPLGALRRMLNRLPTAQEMSEFSQYVLLLDPATVLKEIRAIAQDSTASDYVIEEAKLLSNITWPVCQ